MRHVAAYLLAAMSGKTVTDDSIKNILGSVGVEADEKQLSILLKKFEGKNIEELIEAGASLLSSMPAGGMASGGGGGAPAAGGDAAPAAEKEEEKKEEEEEESDDDMGFGLFD